MTAYYNEFNPDAADWLRNLIAAGLIPAGDVDTRSIEDVIPNELRGYTQCHFFAGIGGWPLALRIAGWPDSRPVWTGSCPCQPFSAAGKGAGFDDERHLWPAWFHLIKECRPAIVFGEQVADAVRHGWIDLVQSDLEGQGYAVGHHVLGAHSVGAPHIRQRLYWVAGRLENSSEQRCHGEPVCLLGRRPQQSGVEIAWGGEAGGLDNAAIARHVGALEDAEGNSRHEARLRVSGKGCGPCGLADTELQQRQDGQPSICAEHEARGREQGAAATSRLRDIGRPRPTNGLWRDADWLGCRDGKWRPVEPGSFPLAHGLPASLGRASARIRELAEVAGLDVASLKAAKAWRKASLHGYGNAIVPQVAAQFIAAAAEVIGYPAHLQEGA